MEGDPRYWYWAKMSCSPDVNVNALNDKFVNINIPTPDSSIYDDLYFVPLENPCSFHCVNLLEVLEIECDWF